MIIWGRAFCTRTQSLMYLSIGTFLCVSLISGCAALAPDSLNFALLLSFSSDSFPPALMRGCGREEGGGRREEGGGGGKEEKGEGQGEKMSICFREGRIEEEPSRGKPTSSLVAIIGGLLSSQPFSESPEAPVTTQV